MGGTRNPIKPVPKDLLSLAFSRDAIPTSQPTNAVACKLIGIPVIRTERLDILLPCTLSSEEVARNGSLFLKSFCVSRLNVSLVFRLKSCYLFMKVSRLLLAIASRNSFFSSFLLQRSLLFLASFKLILKRWQHCCCCCCCPPSQQQDCHCDSSS